MAFERLKNPPLVEAILEMKWRVGSVEQPSQRAVVSGVQLGIPPEGIVDPSYDLLVGQLFKRFSKTYPFHERLPAATIPADIAPFLVQHRFRKGKDAWPLVQIGPGIVALNDTINYRWADFSKRAVTLLNTLYELHPHKTEIVVESLLLRYIDAETFDYVPDSALTFLKDKLKVNFGLPESLFQGEQVDRRPEGLNFQISYPSLRPKGTAALKIATGERSNQRAIVWETLVLSRGRDVSNLPSSAKNWLEDAHTLIHDWFFKLIDGDLLRRYSRNE